MSICTGLIKRLLSNSTHVQFLVQADHVANDKKGLNLAVLLKRVLLACVIIVLICRKSLHNIPHSAKLLEGNIFADSSATAKNLPSKFPPYITALIP